jgi:hypothetical protein
MKKYTKPKIVTERVYVSTVLSFDNNGYYVKQGEICYDEYTSLVRVSFEVCAVVFN